MLKILQIRQVQCAECRERIYTRRQVFSASYEFNERRMNSMSADNLGLSRVQRPVWDTERRYWETRNPDSPRVSLLINRTVFARHRASGLAGSCSRGLRSLLCTQVVGAH